MILIVEDDSDDVLFLRRAIKKIGWDPALHIEMNGEHALRWLRDNTPSHLILDLKLPQVSGLEILASVRGSIPTVVLTSSQEPQDIARAHALGSVGYLVKPVTFANLIRVAEALREWTLKSTLPPIPEMVPAPARGGPAG